jgi:hypothetical protein
MNQKNEGRAMFMVAAIKGFVLAAAGHPDTGS